MNMMVNFELRQLRAQRRMLLINRLVWYAIFKPTKSVHIMFENEAEAEFVCTEVAKRLEAIGDVW